MKYTVDMLVKLEKSYENKRDLLMSDISKYSTFVAATSEKVEDARPDFDLVASVEKLNTCVDAILEIKHIKNCFNKTETINVNGVTMTLDTAIVRLALLNRQYSTLSSLASRRDKVRLGNSGYGSKSSDIEYQYINYDLAYAVKLEKDIRLEIAAIKIAINYAMSNSEVEFNGISVDDI